MHSLGPMYFMARVRKCVPSAEIRSGRILQVAQMFKDSKPIAMQPRNSVVTWQTACDSRQVSQYLY